MMAHKNYNYWMMFGASAADKAQGTVIVEGGGYTLLKAGFTEEWDASAYYGLTAEEAKDARLSHYFVDYTTKTPLDVGFIAGPMIIRDEAFLTEWRQTAIGWFYAKDLTSAERAVKLTKYEGPLQMATAGSVEGAFEALSAVRAVETDPDDIALQDYLLGLAADYLGKFPR
jgi:hypothetical protein